MKISTRWRAYALFLVIISTTTLNAQVKIGGDKKTEPHQSAILELQSSDRGLLLPRINSQQMQAIKEPADALVVYNTDARAIYIYNAEQKQWMPLVYQSARVGQDSCEWEFDSTTLRVFLVRGYPLGDSVYYTTDTKKFVFADRAENTNSLGQDFPVTNFPGKFYFKATGSRFTDSTNLNPTAVTVVFEVDSSGSNNVFRGFSVAAVNNQKNTGKLDALQGGTFTAIAAGQDSVSNIIALGSSAVLGGNGSSLSLTGFTNSAVIRNDATGNLLTMAGIRNSISNQSPTTKINGNVFGYTGNIFLLDTANAPIVTGNVYGIFLGNINGAAPKRNYAFYSNKGHNRFADSTLITDGFSTSPRAVLDVNSTSAMITPAGTTVQRPSVPVTAMFRFNTTGANMEYYNGSAWKALSGDSAEWKFNGVNRVNLVRGLPLGDSVFYTTDTRKFVFSDRTENTNSLGQDFPVTNFPGKYYFKSTASRFKDSANLNPSTVVINMEVDSSGGSEIFRGMQLATVNNPKNTQPLSALQSLGISTIHAGQDSILSLTGVANATTIGGSGNTTIVTGFTNSTNIRNDATGDITSSLAGIRNNLSNASPTTKINGNVFGYSGGVFLLDTLNAPIVSGNVYGIFLSNINGAAPKRNYAFYSNKGHNRLADSTLITDGFFTSPRAVLDVNSTSAMITPAGLATQRPSAPVTAMLRFNTSGANMEFYNGTLWKAFSSDSAEWRFDGVNKVNLVRGLPNADTIFYHTQRKQFIFADRNTNTNSLGQDFPVENFGGKFTFKSTASFKDSALAPGATLNAVYEADNASLATVYNAISAAAVVNPKAFQKADIVMAVSSTSIHSGNDSIQVVYGINNVARNSGNGRSGAITGLFNAARIQNGTNNNTGELAGIRNTLSRSGATAGRVTGNAYGIVQTFSGLNGFVDGSMYGIFIANVNGAAPKKNYAFYSGKGHNRLGDSTLITEGGAISPRAVLDINSTSAMIIPTGSTAQRPTAPVQGMMRYNTSTQSVESYSGSQWNGILRSAININIANMPANTGTTVTVAFTGATVGSVVSVNPSSALPNGVVIAWVRVSVADNVEIRFENTTGAAINPAAQNFNFRIIQ